jgi:hypothetical protein
LRYRFGYDHGALDISAAGSRSRTYMLQAPSKHDLRLILAVLGRTALDGGVVEAHCSG